MDHKADFVVLVKDNLIPFVPTILVFVLAYPQPWVEACVLEAGARQIVTVEYSKIESYHTQIQTLTPNEFREHFLKGKLGLFDAVVTFSSVEHSGLVIV
jgi:hypothetical protein